MLKFSKNIFLKDLKSYKGKNEISFEIFCNILFVKVEFQNEIMKKKKKKSDILALLLCGKFKHQTSKQLK
jgi:hypothetical protein